MINRKDSSHEPDTEQKMAKLLREIDERRRQSQMEQSNEFLDRETVNSLTDAELRELWGAKACLDLLDQMRHQSIRAQDTVGGIRSTCETPALDGGDTARDIGAVIGSVGRYTIQGHLGSGGFGIVLRARDLILDRDIALKILRPELLLIESGRQRFLREARAAACLSHPAIVPIFEAGQADSILYIAYELCVGPTLDRWLNDHIATVTPKQAAQAVVQLAAAVQHAHSRGILHRDLKPGNIVVERDDATGAVSSLGECKLRVTDFGLAQIESGEMESLTQSGAPLGTPAYMSPEQALGKSRVTAATDVYALGAILYQLITGTVPFKRESSFATLQAIINEDVVSPRRLNPHVDRDLAAICLKCLEKSSSKRYATCQALEDELNDYLAGRTVSARSISSLDRAGRWCRRNPVLALTASSLAVVLIASSVISTVLWRNTTFAWRQSEFHESQAAERADDALRQTRRVREAVEQLLTAIAEEPTIRSRDMESFRQTLLVAASTFYQELWAEKPGDSLLQDDYVKTLLLLAEIHAVLDEHARAVEIASEAVHLLDPTDIGDYVQLSSIRSRIANSLLVLGRIDELEVIQQAALESVQTLATHHEHSPEWGVRLADSFARAAFHAIFLKDFDRAEQFNAKAISALEAVYSESSAQWPANETCLQALTNQASLLIQTGRSEEGRPLAERALDVFNAIHGEELFGESSVQYRRSQLLFDLGLSGSYSDDYAFAACHYDIAIELIEDLAARHPDVGLYRDQLVSYRYSRALIHQFQNELGPADVLLTKNLEDIDNASRDFPDRARVLGIHRANCSNLHYAVLRRLGNTVEARQTLNSAITGCKHLLEQFPEDDYIISLLGNFYGNLGFLDNSEGQIDASLKNYEESIDLLEPIAAKQRIGESIQWLSTAYRGAANASEKLGHYSQALEFCGAFERNIPRDDLTTKTVSRFCLVVLAKANRFDESLSRLEDLGAREQPADELLKLAKTAAECAGLAQSASADNSDKSSDHVSRYCDCAIELLGRMTLDANFDREQTHAELSSAKEFQPLRSDKRFSELLRAMTK